MSNKIHEHSNSLKDSEVINIHYMIDKKENKKKNKKIKIKK